MATVHESVLKLKLFYIFFGRVLQRYTYYYHFDIHDVSNDTFSSFISLPK